MVQRAILRPFLRPIIRPTLREIVSINGGPSLPSSLCFDLDATDAASTGTANEFRNKFGNPADGAAQADYHFYLGTSSVGDGAEPTLTGSGAAQYFSLDGGDFFTAIQTTAAKIFNGGHKTSGTDSGPKWILMALQITEEMFGVFWGNTDGGNDFHAIRLVSNNNDDNLRLNQFNASTSFNSEIAATGTFTAGEAIIAVTWDASNPGSEKTFSNSSTGIDWTTAFSPVTTSTDANTAWTFCAGEGAQAPMPSGNRIYSLLGGNSILTDAEMADMITVLNVRHPQLLI